MSYLSVQNSTFLLWSVQLFEFVIFLAKRVVLWEFIGGSVDVAKCLPLVVIVASNSSFY